MFSSYKPEDVTVLLKDITGLVPPLGTRERERLIQSGKHYSEMLPLEYEPSPLYLRAYFEAQDRYAGMTADAVACVAEQIWSEKGRETVLVSLARAGTPIGILIKRYIRQKYQTDTAHYTVSIIKGRGIDRNAITYILTRHRPDVLQFVDGWTGKGAIQQEVSRAMADYPGVDPGLAVLSDPARIAAKRGTYDDFLIPSSCLNATVSGLLSRTFLREDLIGPTDFHGAAYYENLRDKDLTYAFIRSVEEQFPLNAPPAPVDEPGTQGAGIAEVQEIARAFEISDSGLIKPSIGEATRVLLRRVPWKILVHSLDDSAHLGHLYQLAREKGVETVQYPLKNYRACGLIQPLGKGCYEKASPGL